MRQQAGYIGHAYIFRRLENSRIGLKLPTAKAAKQRRLFCFQTAFLKQSEKLPPTHPPIFD
jgi:hypothetical protein